MSPRSLRDLLATVPAVYAELEHAALPVRTGEPTGGGADPLDKPAPGRLEVMEHRHALLTGLRWWVDAVAEDLPLSAGSLGASPARLCAVLLHHLPDMAAEDRATLHEQLDEWNRDAWPLVGRVDTPRAPLPREALQQRVPVHVAAQALGVSVSTIKRRAPRVDGTVKLEDVAGPRCPQSDLPAAWCAHCCAHGVRTVTPVLA